MAFLFGGACLRQVLETITGAKNVSDIVKIGGKLFKKVIEFIKNKQKYDFLTI